MNEQEIKFILRAYRADGSDAADPKFAEALAEAQRDPKLRAWLERERTVDTAVFTKLDAIQPPPDLRDSILAGMRASRPRRQWWTNPVWLGIAAAIVLLLSFTVRQRFAAHDRALSMNALAAFALDDLAHHHDQHEGEPLTILDVQASLANSIGALPGHVNLDLDKLKQKHCRTAHFAGRDVFEICFQREGHWYHLYAARVDNFAPAAANTPTPVLSDGQFAATAWRDSEHVYALVAGAGPDVLTKLI